MSAISMVAPNYGLYMVQVYNNHIDDVISGTKNIEIKRRMDWASSAQWLLSKILKILRKRTLKPPVSES
jgi:hypothetical protein